MISKGKARLFLMVIFTIITMFTITTIKAAPENQTVSIIQTTDDAFVTEVGIGIDADLITILDPNMDITSFLVFRQIKIDQWETLQNATLRLRTANTLDFESTSSVTIYGVKQGNFSGFTDSGAVLSAPLTTAFVNFNTSQFFGAQWWEINITNIVEELIRSPQWEGDELGGAGSTIGIIILGAEGSETRSFYDYRGDPARSAELVIHWGGSQPPPSGDAVFNETNRDFNIWFVDNLGVNRTGVPGAPNSVNWNTLNISALIEIDSGGVLTVNNDTWVSIANLQAQQWDSLYNDTGAANIAHFFVRGAINVTAVTNNLGVGSDNVFSLASISSATPVGGGGLQEGGVGDWVGLMLMIRDNDQDYLFRMKERSGAVSDVSATTGWIDENTNELIYFEFQMKDVGAQNWMSFRLYDNPQFTAPFANVIHVLTQAAEPFRYPQVSSSLAFGLSRITAEEHFFATSPLAENVTWFVTFPNGTIVEGGGDLESYDDAIIFIDAVLGPDPTDPAPPSQGWPEFGVLTRFKTRFYILFIGFIMIFGPLIFFALSRPSGYEFTIGMFIMLIGFALWIAAGSV